MLTSVKECYYSNMILFIERRHITVRYFAVAALYLYY
eukprot:COSAG02_NODE_53827_length_299_cov_1.035000_1_plen_36_part_10